MYINCKAAIANTQTDLDFLRIDKNAFAACNSISIDYALMEPLSKRDALVIAPLQTKWSDVGSWKGLWDISKKDTNGNALLGSNFEEHCILKDTNNSLIYSDQRLISTLGIDDLVIVDTSDTLLVAHKDKVENVTEIVNVLKLAGKKEYLEHKEVHRPWGKYFTVDEGKGYKVKRITLKPAAKISLQKHSHRAEHWVVVAGTAKVVKGNTSFTLTKNQSTYIALGEVHSLENTSHEPLEIIEVQSGSYLGEDDIERLEDKYGRKTITTCWPASNH
jgi:mannose-1-phosphate guanylyltransferase